VVDFAYFCALLPLTLDEGYLFCMEDVDKFEKMGDKLIKFVDY